MFINNKYYSEPDYYLRYESESIIIKYVLKLVYISLIYSFVHLLGKMNKIVEYDESLLDKLLLIYFLFTESGFYFNALKSLYTILVS